MVMPHNVQVAPNGKTVWVTSMGMLSTDFDQVIVINPYNNTVIKRIYLGQELHLAHVVLDEGCQNAFVTTYEGNKIFQINTTTYNVVNTFNLDTLSGPHGMRYSNGKLYIANMDSMSMAIIDVATSQISYIPFGGVAVQTAVTPNGKYAFATLYDTKEVARYNIQTHQITKISLPSEAQGPIQIYPTPDSKHLYVCDQGGLLGRPNSNKVYVIDIENASVNASITVGNKAHGVVVSNDGKFAYVTNVADNTVSKINTSTNTIVSSFSTGLAPNGISYWFGTGGMP
jgi:YVTN family beta-propeller protein